jgi:hypothetical protein
VTRRSSVVPGLALGLALLVPSAPARANGDPPSDVLLGGDLYQPYYPQLSGDVAQRLQSVSDQLRSAHYPIKIAIISSPPDLGTVYSMIGRPGRYARFLSQELLSPRTYGQHQSRVKGVRVPVLVVMSDGIGIAQRGKSLRGVGKVEAPSLPGSDGLAEKAVVAAQRLAARAGHPIKGVGPLPPRHAAPAKKPDSSGSSWVPVALVILLGVAVGAGAAMGLARVSRRSRRKPG